jgi:TRAP-type transport system periplasmic protein
MKKTMYLLILLLFVVSLSLTVGAQTTLRLAHIYDPSHAWSRGAEMAAKLVEERTEGQIKIEVYPNGQLGTEEQITEAAIFGSIDIAISGAGQIGNLFKPINVLEMPYTFENNDHVLRFAKSDIGQQMFADLEQEFSLKVLAAMPYGTRQLTSNKPINTPEDLKGFKLRVAEQQVSLEYARAMGADPTPIAFQEVYMALQQGVVDGQENPLPTIHAQKFYEVQDYINLTSHVINCGTFVMNGDKFNSLSEEHQQVMLDAWSEVAEFITADINESEKKLGAFFEEEGCTLIEPDIDAFREATKDMPTDFAKWWIRYGADLHSRIQNL